MVAEDWEWRQCGVACTKQAMSVGVSREFWVICAGEFCGRVGESPVLLSNHHNARPLQCVHWWGETWLGKPQVVEHLIHQRGHQGQSFVAGHCVEAVRDSAARR